VEKDGSARQKREKPEQRVPIAKAYKLRGKEPEGQAKLGRLTNENQRRRKKQSYPLKRNHNNRVWSGLRLVRQKIEIINTVEDHEKIANRMGKVAKNTKKLT